MRITGIELNHWMIHRHLNLDIKPLTIIAGPNESGKSSIADAVAFVVFNELRRVTTKGERPMLISEGAQKGSVTVRAGDAMVQRDIGTGKLRSDAMMPVRPGAIGAATPFLLSPALFGRATAEERRTVLSKVMQVPLNPEGLLEAIKQRGAPAFVLKDLPLTEPIEKWRAIAKEAAAQGRGAWKQITGEAYGAAKAETWQAHEPEPLPGTAADHDAAVKTARAKMTSASEALATQRAHLQAQVEYEERSASLRARAAKLPAAKTAEAAAKYAVEVAETNLADERAAHVKVPGAADTTSCPACGVILMLTEDGDLEEVKHTTSAAEIAAQEAVREAQTRHRQAVIDLAAAQAAKEALDALSPPADSAAGSIPDLQQAADAAAEAFDTANAAKNAFTANQEAIAKAKKATESAKGAHQKVEAWTKADAWLAPDGIPGELLGKALQPFNATLATLSGRAGWKVVTVSEDMSIAVGGRSYGLQSESGQWRADAIIALALAIHSDMRMVTIDRFDVLEPGLRKPAIIFFRSLTREEGQEIDTLIVLGTFKEPPGAPPDIAVHWLGEKPNAAAQAA